MGDTTYHYGDEKPAAPSSPPVPFAVFADSLRPTSRPLMRNGKAVTQNGGPVAEVVPGHDDEVWLRLLYINHGSERLTLKEWSACIDLYRDQPAYPSAPGVS